MLYDKGDHTIITDSGETKEVFDEVSHEEWVKICEENGFEFRLCKIEHEYCGQ